MEECQRKSSDRRADDRRIEDINIEIDRRISGQRRSGCDRREILSGQVS